jgi:hypothetical protein
MSTFDYLAVLVSIILAIGLTELVSRTASILVHFRDQNLWWGFSRLCLHPASLWAIILFLAQIQFWWSYFELRELPIWTFWAFFFLRLGPAVLMCLLDFLVLPPKEKQVSLEDHFKDINVLFFSVATPVPLLNAIDSLLRREGWDIYKTFQVLFALMLMSAAFVNSRKIGRLLDGIVIRIPKIIRIGKISDLKFLNLLNWVLAAVFLVLFVRFIYIVGPAEASHPLRSVEAGKPDAAARRTAPSR